jgi:hypothetical protein
VLAPEGPPRGAIGQSVLDDQSDSGIDDAPCIVAAWVGQVGHVGVEVLAATGAIVLRVDQDQVAGSSGKGISQVVEGATSQSIAVGALSTAGTGSPPIISALDADLGLG